MTSSGSQYLRIILKLIKFQFFNKNYQTHELIMQLWYAYAKTLGEKEAWRIAKESGIDLVVVNPSFVVGPLLAPQPASTLLMILGIIKG
jgi:nucleoside-diphosphate-sugar epimerase